MNSRIKILVVEDEALIADEIRRVLESLGYEPCAICYDYASAAAAIPHTDADLFLLDINLGGKPENDGVALAGLVRSCGDKPFIFLTAYSDKDTITKATARHPANYLIKPVNPAALFAAIQLAIARTQDATPLQVGEEPARQPDFFFVKLGLRKEKIFWADVSAIEAAKNYARVYVKDGKTDYPVRGTIAFVLDQLVPEPLRDNFVRLSRSVCLNSSHITSVTDDTVVCGGRSFENTGRIQAEMFATQQAGQKIG